MADWAKGSITKFFELDPGYAFKSADFIGAGVPVIKIKNIKAGHFSEREFSYVSPHFLSLRANKLARPGDLLISMSGNRHDGSPETWVGKIALFKKEGHFFINQRVGALRRKPSAKIDIRFASYLLSSFPYQELFISIATSSGGQANLSPQQILSAPLSYPNLETQIAIGEVLGALDDKIDLNRRLNETLEATARAIFKDWFVDFGPTRAKLEGSMPYLAPETWALFPDRLDDEGRPVAWQIGSLTDIAEITMGISPDGSTYNEQGDGMPLVNGPVEYDDFFLRRIKWTTAPNKVSRRGDLIICVRGSTTGRHAFSDGEYCLGRGVASIRSRNNQQEFVDACVLGHIDRLLQRTTGSVFPSLSSNDFRSFDILVPSSGARKAFCEAVRPMRDQVWANVEQSSTLGSLRDLLLPKLMSGGIRVKDVEKVAEAAL
jgi:type I restriction enzyme, S subunit